MANPLYGEASFQAGAETKTLVFDVNVFCDLEADTGLGVNGLLAKIEADPSFTLLRDIITAALQPKHEPVTKREAGKIMTEAGLDEVTDAMKRALQQAMPKKKGKEGGDDADPPRPAAKPKKR